MSLFKKFEKSESVINTNILKSSAQRSIKKNISDVYGISEEDMELMLPKKLSLLATKCRDHLTLFSTDGLPLYFQCFDGPYCPTLRLLHKYPGILPRAQVDAGAIKSILQGADIMCPGLTSSEGSFPPDLLEGMTVGVFADGKQHALAIGKVLMDSGKMYPLRA